MHFLVYIITTVIRMKCNSGKSTVNVSNYCGLCVEIFKTLNDINPSFRKDVFNLRIMNRPTREKYKLNLEIPKSNQVRFGTKKLRCLGPKALHMQDMQKVKLCTFRVFFPALKH